MNIMSNSLVRLVLSRFCLITVIYFIRSDFMYVCRYTYVIKHHYCAIYLPIIVRWIIGIYLSNIFCVVPRKLIIPFHGFFLLFSVQVSISLFHHVRCLNIQPFLLTYLPNMMITKNYVLCHDQVGACGFDPTGNSWLCNSNTKTQVTVPVPTNYIIGFNLFSTSEYQSYFFDIWRWSRHAVFVMY